MTTRRQLLGSASTAIALALPRHARAAANQDKDLLELLTAYTSAVVVAYEQAPPGRSLGRFKADVTQMDDALRQTVAKRGGSPPPRRPAGAPSRPGGVSRAEYLRHVVASEEALESAWFAALQKLADRRVLEGAIAYMAAGGRRLVVLRELAGLPLLPRAFETGSFP